MKRIVTNISVISVDGGDFGNFSELEHLYSKLSGAKCPNENVEFIKIGKNMILNNNVLEVIDINLKFDGIDKNISHKEKEESLVPKDLIIKIYITVEFVRKL